MTQKKQKLVHWQTATSFCKVNFNSYALKIRIVRMSYGAKSI
jgi:hypothetical protein